MATTQRSLKQLAAACDKIAASVPKMEDKHEQQSVADKVKATKSTQPKKDHPLKWKKDHGD